MDDAKTSQVFEAGAPYGTLEPKKKALAEVIEESVRGDVRIIDWVSKDDVQRDIRSRIKRSLTAASYPDDARAKLAARILDLLKAREGR